VAQGEGSHERGWQRLGHLIAAERGRRKWTVAELAARAELSERTIDYLESGARGRYRDSTLGRIEDAFGWRPGRALAVAHGAAVSDDPSDQQFEQVQARWPYLTHEQRQVIVDLLETMTRQR
jgi:transcriptional regulator with XRE-family HTH domain